MWRSAFVLLWLTAAGTLAAQAPPALPSVDLPAPLPKVLRDYEAAWQRKDAAALAALFAEDGFVLSSGVPPMSGRAAIARQAGEPDAGKFTLTLRRGADGRWMIVSDMDNGNARP